jgi:hypothetical protein
MPKQLNIFLENKPGRLESVTEVLSQKGISVIAFTIQDRGDFGVIKLLVDKPDQAYLVLADKGFACALKEVLLIAIKDKTGNLHKLTALLLKHKINVVDAHGFVIAPDKEGICCLELKEEQDIKGILTKEGFRVLSEEGLGEFYDH